MRTDLVRIDEGRPGVPAPRGGDLVSAILATLNAWTARTYMGDYRDWARFLSLSGPAEAIDALIAMGPGETNRAALAYRVEMTGRGLAPGTIARRLVALRGACKAARRIGHRTSPGVSAVIHRHKPSTLTPCGKPPVTKTATIRVPALKVTVPLDPDALPRHLVPPDGPPGEPVLDLALEGGALTVRARLNGRNYRKLLKQVDEHGASNLAVALQGVLRAPAEPGGPFRLEEAGFQAVVKTPRPSAPEYSPISTVFSVSTENTARTVAGPTAARVATAAGIPDPSPHLPEEVARTGAKAPWPPGHSGAGSRFRASRGRRRPPRRIWAFFNGRQGGTRVGAGMAGAILPPYYDAFARA